MPGSKRTFFETEGKRMVLQTTYPISCENKIDFHGFSTYYDGVSIDVLKQELAALDAEQQRLMTAFLVSLQDSRDVDYRGKLAA
ncbi:MAG TPA: hypothetical protein VFC07_08240, partial [Verrucomicrobiae bacterium]|nr:hypothetical protein [Verrucomicrobiae bacterium]